MHYVLDMQAPYGLFSLPKLLGIPGGLLLTAGAAWLVALKLRAERALGAASAWGGEMAFVLLLGLTGLTGLMLYLATGTALVQPLLAVHLGAVLAFFLTTPYSKMVHGFYRLAALIRNAQVRP
jgi:citrate/tricarballylate utilization protein